MELKVEDIRKSFSGFEVLKGISFEIRGGDVLLLLGPNASGKSTLLKIVSTIIKPDSGRVILNGTDIVRRPGVMRKVLAYVPEVPSLVEELSVRANLKFFSRLFKVNSGCKDLVKRLGLEGELEKPVHRISKGVKQRLSLAVSLLRRPDVVILDEPTSGLDRETTEIILDMVADLSRNGKIVLVASHDEEDLLRVATHVLIIESGEVVEFGRIEELENKRLAEVLVDGGRKTVRLGDVASGFRIKRIMGLRESLMISANERGQDQSG